MKKQLGRFVRVSPAMVVAMIALFVALTGTAVATTSALITGNQIKNSSITGADIKNKSLKPIDFRGSVRGPRGLQGLPGAAGAKGDKGDKGDQGDPGPFPGALPSGKTIRGVYAVVDTAGAAGNVDQTPISFGFRLASAPTLHYIQLGAPSVAACPGSGSNPQAQPGHLCLYETFQSNTSGRNVQAVSDPQSGAEVYMSAAAAGDYYIFGSWAVTSP